MDIGIGLPSTVGGTDGRTLIEWAIRSEAAGFSTLGVLDRLVYDSYDGLTVLAAAAAVTERIRLTTAVLLAPLRTNTALLAKQAASVDRLSDGRLVLGLAVGARPDDFTASRLTPAGRGDMLDAQLVEMARIWAGERRGFAGAIGPRPVAHQGPEVVLGGHSPAAMARTVRRAEGWISGGGGVDMFAAGATTVVDAWHRSGRPGRPRLLSLAYVALGPDAHDIAHGYLDDYYGFAPPYAAAVARNAAIGEEGLRRLLDRFDEAECDELVLVPCSADPRQLDLLEGVVADRLGRLAVAGAR